MAKAQDSPFDCPECGCSEGMFRVRLFRTCIVKAIITCAECGHIYEYPTVFEPRFEGGAKVGYLEISREEALTREYYMLW